MNDNISPEKYSKGQAADDLPTRHHINSRDLITELESHWRSRFQPQAVHDEIVASLHRIREVLSQDNDDAKLVLHVYERWLQGKVETDQLAAANHALEHIIEDLGLLILGALPLGFLSVPAVFALAHHFRVDLRGQGGGHQESSPDSHHNPTTKQHEE